MPVDRDDEERKRCQGVDEEVPDAASVNGCEADVEATVCSLGPHPINGEKECEGEKHRRCSVVDGVPWR